MADDAEQAEAAYMEEGCVTVRFDEGRSQSETADRVWLWQRSAIIPTSTAAEQRPILTRDDNSLGHAGTTTAGGEQSPFVLGGATWPQTKGQPRGGVYILRGAPRPPLLRRRRRPRRIPGARCHRRGQPRSSSNRRSGTYCGLAHSLS
jgi:hypothetical protein